MEKNKKFDAEKIASELWEEVVAKDDKLTTDSAKRIHINAFFRKKKLTQSQSEAVIAAMSNLISIEKDFTSMPYVLEMYDLWTNKQFHYFFKDKNATIGHLNMSDMDLSRYFNEKKIPLWQRDVISENFMVYMQLKSRENRSKVIIPLLVCYGGTLVLALFTPMILQRFGFLAPDAGWGIKVLNTIGSFFFLFLIARRVNSFWLDKVLLGK